MGGGKHSAGSWVHMGTGHRDCLRASSKAVWPGGVCIGYAGLSQKGLPVAMVVQGNDSQWLYSVPLECHLGPWPNVTQYGSALPVVKLGGWGAGCSGLLRVTDCGFFSAKHPSSCVWLL